MILLIADSTIEIKENYLSTFETLATQLNRLCTKTNLEREQIVLYCEQHEVSLLVLFLPNHTKTLQKYLTACRGLRMPYLVITPQMQLSSVFAHILLPVGFLEEELEKAHFATMFGRFCHAKITLLQAKDYGSRAQRNVEKIAILLDKFKLNYTHAIAKKADSFSVEKEAVARAQELQADMVVVSASRDYGLDDILFGPKERRVLVKSLVPILIINPRKDLYTMCD